MPREFADDKKKKPVEAKAEVKAEPKVETPPAVPASKPPEEKPIVPTAEELEARAKEVMSGMFPVMGAKKPAPAPEAEKPVEKPPEEKKEEKVAVEPEKKPEVKKPLPPPITEAVKPEDLQAPAPKVELKPRATGDLTEEDEESLATLARMEKDGKADRGIVDRTKRFWTDEAAYIDAWQKAHPGETFDIENEEHAEFYDKNEPKYNPREFDRTQRAMQREEDRRINKEEIKKETEAETYEREMREHTPRNVAAVTNAMTEMVADAGFRDLMTKDGKVVLTKEIEAEIDKASPNARAILIDEAQLLSVQVAEIDKLERFSGKYKVNENLSVKVANGAYVQPHRMLMDFAVGLETEIAALPPEDTMRDGKRFVPQSEFTGAVEKIMQSPAAPEVKQRAFDQLTSNYYTLGWEDIRLALITKHATQARDKIERFGGTKRAEAAPAAAKTTAATQPFAPPEQRGSTRAPSISSSSDNVDTGKKVALQSGKTQDQVVDSMFPRHS